MSLKSDCYELEDGEIDFDASFDEGYTPLERPVCSNTVRPSALAESDTNDNDSLHSSDSDSSCDGTDGPKLKKNKSNESKKPKHTSKQNKLKIWCNVLEDESLSNNLTDCNLDESQMRIRGLLPYARNLDDFSRRNQKSGAGKRNHGGQLLNGKKQFKNAMQYSKKGAPKHIQPLPKNAMQSDELLSEEIAKKLQEIKTDLILRAVQIAGRERIKSLFDETRSVEKSGGLLVLNGSRRRTAGGTFFHLLKSSPVIPQEQLREIFSTDKMEEGHERRKEDHNKPSTATSTGFRKRKPKSKKSKNP